MNNNDLKEVKQHGTDDFNFDFYQGWVGSKFKISVHWHYEYEIIHVVEGELNLLINGEKHVITSNQAILIDSQSVHSQIIEDDKADLWNQARYFCYVFGEQFLFPDKNSYIYKEIYSTIKKDNICLTQIFDSTTQFGRDILALLNPMCFLQTDRKNAIKIQSTLLSIFDMIIENKAYSITGEKSFENNTLIIKALELIHGQNLNDCSISDMANILHVNVDYFIKLFKKHVGLTPNKYILELRLDKATQLVRYSKNITISQVAEECGFKDLNYFCRVFKKYNKQTATDIKLGEEKNLIK